VNSISDANVGLVRELSIALAEVSPNDGAMYAVLAGTVLLSAALAVRILARRQSRISLPAAAPVSIPSRQVDFEDAPIALLQFSRAGALAKLNREAAALLRLPHELADAHLRTWSALFGAESFDEICAALEVTERAQLEVPFGHGAVPRWLLLKAGRSAGDIGLCVEEITERRAYESRLRHLVDHDPLTGLLNRRGFDQRRQLALAAVQNHQPLALAYLDLDRFKLVNDLFGHNAGDHVLRLVAERLRARIRDPHALARVGGDEFVMLFVGVSLADAQSLCMAALDAVRGTPYTFDDKAFSVDGSIGLASVDGDLLSPDLIIACDRACAQAKLGGGGRIVVVDDSASAVREHQYEARIIRLLRSDEPSARVVTRMQPIVSLHHPGRSLAYEVLLRMRDERGEPIASSRYVRIAERNGLTSRLDRQVLKHTLAWLDEHPAHRDKTAFVAANVSRASLNDERFLADVRSMLLEHSVSASRICFDVSESALLGDTAGTHRFIDIIRGFGARLAVDGFGGQFMSFSCLKNSQCDFVKIDPALVRDINANPANYSIVRAIVDVCHDLGLLCVGEWAENVDIVRALLELRVDYAQGFALSEPLEPDEILAASDCSSLVRDPVMAAVLGTNRSDSHTAIE
jgi:diguanylate cyclase (GGDEF)-like protein